MIIRSESSCWPFNYFESKPNNANSQSKMTKLTMDESTMPLDAMMRLGVAIADEANHAKVILEYAEPVIEYYQQQSQLSEYHQLSYELAVKAQQRANAVVVEADRLKAVIGTTTEEQRQWLKTVSVQGMVTLGVSEAKANEIFDSITREELLELYNSFRTSNTESESG